MSFNWIIICIATHLLAHPILGVRDMKPEQCIEIHDSACWVGPEPKFFVLSKEGLLNSKTDGSSFCKNMTLWDTPIDDWICFTTALENAPCENCINPRILTIIHSKRPRNGQHLVEIKGYKSNSNDYQIHHSEFHIVLAMVFVGTLTSAFVSYKEYRGVYRRHLIFELGTSIGCFLSLMILICSVKSF